MNTFGSGTRGRRRPVASPSAALAAIALAACAITNPASAGCRMKGPDVSIYGMTLLDADAAAKQVGSGAPLAEDEDDLPAARFVSQDGAEELALFAHFGAPLDEYAEVEVRYAGQEAMTLKELPTRHFTSESGIGLGMSPADVEQRLGRCRKSVDREGSSEVVQYEIAKADRDAVLKPFGHKTYYAEYEFRAGRLVRFRYGFEMPEE